MNTEYQPKLSASGKMAVVLGLAFMGQVAVAAPMFSSSAAKRAALNKPVQQVAQVANIEAVQGGATVFKQNKVDVVNIVQANEQGLSHNQFNKFNVAKEGAVLNNAVAAGKSQLAGDLAANANLQGKAASVILNEVVSKNPSLILGQQEIFGMAADYVLANPNGITYNGGNILNASRASLVVGRPDIQGGSLKAFTVGANGAAQELRVNGVMSGNDVVDLVAPKVVVSKSANLNAGKINMITGSNKVGYTDGSIEKLEQAKNAPVLDGQVFGAMRAGSIRIHGTDSRATQKIEGANVQADSSLNVETAGDVLVRAANVSGGDITIAAKNTTVDGSTSTATNSYNIQSNEANRVKAVRSGVSTTETFNGSSINASGALNLQNTGDIALNGATVDAGSLNASAKNVTTGTATTTNVTVANYNRSKGSWYNNSRNETQDATVHNTKINVKGGAVVDAAQNLTLKAAVLNVGGDAKLAGQNGITTQGVTETDNSLSRVDFARETAKLKTGYSSKIGSEQKQIGTQINVGGDLGLVTGQALNTQATDIQAAGNVVTSAKTINLAAQTTSDVTRVDDKLKYWGGIGGGKDGLADKYTEALQGTSVVSKEGNVLLAATNGVTVAGGTVKGKTGAFVNAGTGSVNIKSATTVDIENNSNRTGTVFNITKNKTQNTNIAQKVNGTVLASDAELTVVADKNINVIGSSLQAAEKLGIQTAGDLNIAAAQAKNISSQSEFSIKGKSNAGASLKKGSASAGLGLVFTNATTNTTSTVNTGSALSGDNVALTANQNVSVSGSQVNAANNVDVAAKNVEVTAANDVVVTNEKKRVTDVGVTGTVSYNGGKPKVGVNAGVSSAFSDTTTTNTTAQVSGISAGKDVTVKATQNIKNKGTKIAAAGDVNQSAQNITNEAAQNSSNVSTVKHEGGINVGASVSTAKLVTVEGKIYGQGGKSQTTSTTAVAGSVTANNVNLTADNNITDVATNYTANGNLNVTAQNYDNQAAANTQSVNAKQGGASIGLAVSTSDGQTFDVDAKVGVNYAGEKGKSSQAVKGNIAANNVNIAAGNTAAVASNINATESVNINAANGVTFTQSQDTAESSKVGVDVGVGVGAKVHVSGAVAPKGSLKVGVNTANKQTTQGSAGTVTAGQDIVATAANGKVKVDGANLVAENLVKLEGNVVESNGLTNTRKEGGVSVNAAVGASSILTETTKTQTTTSNEYTLVGCGCEPPKLVLTGTTTTTQSETEIGSQMSGANMGLNVGVRKENEVTNAANVIIGKGGMTTTPDKVIKEPDQVITKPSTVKIETVEEVVPGETEIASYYDENTSMYIEYPVTTPPTTRLVEKEVVVPGETIVIPGKETVIPGSTQQTGGVIINANSAGNGVSIKGTNIEAGVANITNAGGNVHIGSLEGSLKKTNASAGVSVNLDVNGGQVKPTSGSVEVSVDLAKNKTFTGSSITATDAVNINANNNLDLISSTITAPNVQGNVGGNLNIEAQQNVVNETSVDVAIAAGKQSGGFKPTKTETVEKTEACTPCGKQETITTTTVETKKLGSKVKNPQSADNNAVIAAGGTVLQGAQTVQSAVEIAENLKAGRRVERDDIANVMTTAIGTVTTAAQNKGKVSDALNALSDDIDAGSIKGVNASLNVAFDAEKSKTTNKTGVSADNLNLNVGGNISNQAGQVNYTNGTGFGDAQVVHSGNNVDSARKVNGYVNLTTDIAQNIAYGIEHAQTGKSPVAGGSSSLTAPTTVAASITKN